jgi:hypothetical protein
MPYRAWQRMSADERTATLAYARVLLDRLDDL